MPRAARPGVDLVRDTRGKGRYDDMSEVTTEAEADDAAACERRRVLDEVAGASGMEFVCVPGVPSAELLLPLA